MICSSASFAVNALVIGGKIHLVIVIQLTTPSITLHANFNTIKTDLRAIYTLSSLFHLLFLFSTYN
jgi:hypothetical protein